MYVWMMDGCLLHLSQLDLLNHPKKVLVHFSRCPKVF